MSYTPMVTVHSAYYGNVALPEPSTYEGNTATLVDSARNSAGYVVGAVVRDDIGKISMSFNYLTVAQWADILKLFSIRSHGSFINSVTFFCQDTGTWETRKMYVSDRSAGVFMRKPDGTVDGYKGVKLDLIEV